MSDFGELFALYLKVLITGVVVVTVAITLAVVAIVYGVITCWQ